MKNKEYLAIIGIMLFAIASLFTYEASLRVISSVIIIILSTIAGVLLTLKDTRISILKEDVTDYKERLVLKQNVVDAAKALIESQNAVIASQDKSLQAKQDSLDSAKSLIVSQNDLIAVRDKQLEEVRTKPRKKTT